MRALTTTPRTGGSGGRGMAAGASTVTHSHGIWVGVIAASMSACTAPPPDRSDPVETPDTMAAVVWDRVEVRDAPGDGGEVIGATGFGGNVIVPDPSGLSGPAHIRVRFVERTDDAWMPAAALRLGARGGAVRASASLYDRPSYVTLTTETLQPPEAVVITSEADDWCEVIDGAERPPKWVRCPSLTTEPIDVAVAVTLRAMERYPDDGVHRAELRRLLRRPAQTTFLPRAFRAAYPHLTCEDLQDSSRVKRLGFWAGPEDHDLVLLRVGSTYGGFLGELDAEGLVPDPRAISIEAYVPGTTLVFHELEPRGWNDVGERRVTFLDPATARLDDTLELNVTGLVPAYISIYRYALMAFRCPRPR